MSKKGWFDYNYIPGTNFKAVYALMIQDLILRMPIIKLISHTTIDFVGDGEMVDYHHSVSPKGQKFVLRQPVNPALLVSGSLSNKLSDNNSHTGRGIDN